MALPDYIKISLGTAIVLGDINSSGVTHNILLNGLANATAVASASIDLGATWDEEYLVVAALKSASGTAPSVGGTVDIYLPCTHDTSYWPGGLTGASGTWPSDGAEDEWALQLGAPITSLIATNDASAMQVQAGTIFRPTARYCQCVVDNNLSTPLWDNATASLNVSRVFLVPRVVSIVD